MLHLSVTDAVEPDPVDFFQSPSENLASPVTGKIFIITYPASLWLPRCDFYIPSKYHLCMFEKGKTATWQNGDTWWKICWPGDLFFRKPGETLNATGSYVDGYGVVFNEQQWQENKSLICILFKLTRVQNQSSIFKTVENEGTLE